MPKLELYRNVRLTEREFDKVNEIATNEGEALQHKQGYFYAKD